MPTTFQCPSCAGTIEYTSNNQAMTCPYCGTAITTPGESSAATVIMPKVEESSSSAKTVIQQGPIKNSAEIIDEVKRSLREDDKNGAVRIFSKEFNVSISDAQASVDQIEIDMKHSGKEAVAAAPAPIASPAPMPMPAPTPAASSSSAQQIPQSDILDAVAPEEKKSNTTRNWIIGCSIAFILFCCLCITVSVVGNVVMRNMGN